MDKMVSFAYGLIAPSLEEQAREQGFTLGDDGETLEKIREGLFMCRVHAIVSDSEAGKAYTRLNKKVVKALMPIEMPEPPGEEVDDD